MTNVIELNTKLNNRTKADKLVFTIEINNLEDWKYFKAKLIEQGLFSKFMAEMRLHGN